MKRSFVINLSLLVIFFASGFYLVSQLPTNLKPENVKSVNIGGQDVKVSLALTGPEQAQGLSGRSGLGKNEGMLFVMSYPGNHSFWMKNMKFPIDIVWITEDLKVAYIKKDARPDSYPQVYRPGQNAKYVLEVKAGFSDRNKLKEGDIVLFTY